MRPCPFDFLVHLKFQGERVRLQVVFLRNPRRFPSPRSAKPNFL